MVKQENKTTVVRVEIFEGVLYGDFNQSSSMSKAWGKTPAHESRCDVQEDGRRKCSCSNLDAKDFQRSAVVEVREENEGGHFRVAVMADEGLYKKWGYELIHKTRFHTKWEAAEVGALVETWLASTDYVFASGTGQTLDLRHWNFSDNHGERS